MSGVLVLGNATLDVIQRVQRLPAAGETMLASATIRCAGGKGLNQAIAAARTGARTRLVAPVGCDGDAVFLAESVAREASLMTTWLACQAATDLSVIWVAQDGENVIVSSADCAHAVTGEQARDVCGALADGDMLVMQGNLKCEVTRLAAQIARARGARCVLNTAPLDWDMTDTLRLFDIITANEGEAKSLTRGAVQLGAAFRELGVGTAIVTQGPKGALIFDQGRDIRIAAPQVTARDTAGAGDVFVGTLAGLLAQGRTLSDAATIAIHAASLSVTRANTTPSFPTQAELAALVETFQNIQTSQVPHA